MELFSQKKVQDFTTIQKGVQVLFSSMVFKKVCSRSDFWIKNISIVFFQKSIKNSISTISTMRPRNSVFVDFWKTSSFTSSFFFEARQILEEGLWLRVEVDSLAWYLDFLLLMVQKSGEKTTWEVKIPVNFLGFQLPTSSGERRISEASTVV